MDRNIGRLINELFDSVLVLNLPESADRRAHIDEHFGQIGLAHYQFVEAIGENSLEVEAAYKDGLVKTYPPCFRCGQVSCGRDDCNNVLISPQVGNFLSHLKIWKKVAEMAHLTLVVEDDVVFEPYAGATLSKLNHHIQNNPTVFNSETPILFRLGWAKCEEHTADSEFSVRSEVRMSNPCYALTSSFARQLVQQFSEIATTSDVFLHQKAPKPGQAFSVFPPVASERSWSQGSLPSLIHPKASYSDYLRNAGENDKVTAYDEIIDRHIAHKFLRPILVIGHPRCGTGFTANLMRQCNLDVGHENDGKDGISSWMLAVDDLAPYALSTSAKQRAALIWDTLILPVRNLETAVPSVMRENRYAPPSYAYRRKHILAQTKVDLDNAESEFECAILSILNWVEMIEAQKPSFVYRIEDQAEKLVEFLCQENYISSANMKSLDLTPFNADKAYKGVRYPKETISVADWATLTDETWSKVLKYCKKYGYQAPC